MGAALIAMQRSRVKHCDSAAPEDCKRSYIKAIGVLGTDIYDKLLVLQELRPMFPDVVFFTFGLDARYTDDENLPWTRQMLIGSSLGLSLQPELQADIPAFRDTYQATTFYATLFALHRASLPSPGTPAGGDDEAGLQWTRHATVFEIGRKQPLDLNLDNETKECRFDGQCPAISASRIERFYDVVRRPTVGWMGILVPALLWILLRAAFGRAAMHRRLGFLPVSLTGLIVVLALAVAVMMRMGSVWNVLFHVLTRGNHHMPVPIADGASHWGKELLEACMIPLIITLLIRGQRKLNDNAEIMRSQFGFRTTFDVLTERYARSLPKPWGIIKEWIYVPIGHLSSDQDPLPVLPHTSPLEALIARYLYRGVWWRRWRRVLAETFIFMPILKFLDWLGFSAFSGVPWVPQGNNQGVEGWIAFLCIMFMQVLIFWVIDAILLTRAFMLDVARDSPPWPKDTLKEPPSKLGLRRDFPPIWLDLRLIARRTSWVSGFIWYPSLVIAGMFAATFTFEYGRYHFESNPVIFIASIGLIVAAVVLLRQGAESWRADVLQRLDHDRLALLAAKPARPEAVAELEVLVDLVTGLRDGAFAPYSEQPLVKAVLLPLITFAATAGLPYLHAG